MPSSPDFSSKLRKFIATFSGAAVGDTEKLVATRTTELHLRLRHPFAIAHGVSTSRNNVLVQIGSGLGEAPCVPYRQETPQRVADYLAGLDWEAIGWQREREPLHLAHVVAALPDGSPAARAAVDMALHDVWAQRLGMPLYQCLGLNPGAIPLTSETLAQAQPEDMAARAKDMQVPSLKLKLGAAVELDVARLQAVAQACSSKLRVDANGGWSLQQALWILPQLAAQGVELVEQPLAIGDLAGLRVLAELSVRPPIYVDESIDTVEDIVAHAPLVEGVVIKLAKAGGIAGALQQIAVARGLGLRVMLSCMVESSVGVTAAAHIAPLVDEVDLDGPLLIVDEPFEGVTIEGGRLSLSARPGLGLRERHG